MSLLALFDEARRTGDLAPLAAAIPAARFLGLSVERSGDELRTRLDFAPHLIGNALLPALHGGTIASLLESAAIFGLLWDTRAQGLPKTISITVEYLRTARPTTTWARTEIIHHGRRVATVRGLAYQDDPARPVAAATVHLLVKST
jgi:uncharacterized protein (TIGR00369 family)